MDLIFLKSLRPLYCDYISRILCVRRAQQRRPPRPPFMYFYSRPYARGDRLDQRTLDDGAISTHAPTRGTTGIFSNCVCPMIFLLAPLREGRQQFFTKPQVDLYDKLLKIHIFKLTLSVYSNIRLKTLKITLLGLHEPPGKMCTGRVGVRK